VFEMGGDDGPGPSGAVEWPGIAAGPFLCFGLIVGHQRADARASIPRWLFRDGAAGRYRLVTCAQRPSLGSRRSPHSTTEQICRSTVKRFTHGRRRGRLTSSPASERSTLGTRPIV
jgi:hypothetical protein